MFASVLIVILSSALFAYWLRHTCVELLRRQAEGVAAFQPAVRGTLGLADIRERLQAGGELSPVHSLLQRDYQVLMYLTRHASGSPTGKLRGEAVVLGL